MGRLRCFGRLVRCCEMRSKYGSRVARMPTLAAKDAAKMGHPALMIAFKSGPLLSADDFVGEESMACHLTE
jgi:hypothetical protein